MTARAALRKTLGQWKPNVFRPKMFTNPVLRRYAEHLERTRMKFETEKRAIVMNRALSDDEVSRRWTRAMDRYMAADKKSRAIMREYERKYELPRLKEIAARQRAVKRRR